jgi:hypothetical protein
MKIHDQSETENIFIDFFRKSLVIKFRLVTLRLEIRQKFFERLD